jgi:O-methyltransferase
MNPLDYAKKICYSSEETLLFTYEQAKKYADSDGVYVECGVAVGAQIIAMAAGAPNKTIYAFDSFEGIPLPSNRDDQYPGIRVIDEVEQSKLPDPGKQKLESSGATVHSIGNFWDNIQASGIKPNNIVVVKGWFEETTDTVFYESMPVFINILRLDGDLYNSTLVCLQNLFPFVAKGGLVIIDDWNLKGCQDACKEYFGSIGYKPDYKFISDIAYFIK